MLIHRSNLLAALCVAGVKDVRYYFNGVHIEPDGSGAMIIGCDGARIAAIREKFEGQKSPSFTIPREAVASLKRARAAALVEIVFDPQTSLITITDEDRKTEIKAVDGRFPEWRRVIPAQIEGPLNAQIDLALVEGFVKAAAIMGFKSRTLRMFGAHSAAVFQIENVGTFTGVLMKIQGEFKPQQVVL